MPNDSSETADNARKINSFAKLNGLTCIVKIGIERDKSGKFDDRNSIVCAITLYKKEYEIFMNSALEPERSAGRQPKGSQNNNVSGANDAKLFSLSV
jgi:hypothetical protein